MGRDVKKEEVGLVLVFVRYTNYFKFMAAFPMWTKNQNQAYISAMRDAYGRENVAYRLYVRKAARNVGR